MKQIISLLLLLLSSHLIFAQAPEKMSYQAVIRDFSNNLLANTQVGTRVSIIKDSINGTAEYVETHIASTNPNGLLTLEIGTGAVVSGSFSGIDWGNGTYFVRTETDPNGGTSYSITGESQLLSVPYALHAKTADNILECGDKVELVRLFWSANTASSGWVSGMARPKFDKEYFANVDSITFYAFLRTTDPNNFAQAQLYDVVANQNIPNSLVQNNQGSGSQPTGWTESGDLMPYFPNGEFTLGIRMRSATAGIFSALDQAFLVIYRH